MFMQLNIISDEHAQLLAVQHRKGASCGAETVEWHLQAIELDGWEGIKW